MRTLALILVSAIVAAAADTGSAVDQAACKPGGFTVINFGSTEATGKAGNSFSVFFDSANFQGNNFDPVLRTDMSTWSGVSGSTWHYDFSGYTAAKASSSDGVMTLVNGGGFPFPAGVLATTVISTRGSAAQIFDSDTFFNPSVSFSTSPGLNDFDFQSVALHEMGHGFGLHHNDACNPTPTVMHSTISPGEQRRTLFTAETAGVSYLYPVSTGGGGGVTIAPASLVFNAVAGGAPPASQTLAVTVAAGTAWSASVSTSTGPDWLLAGPKSGTGPGQITVTLMTGALAGGFYSGRITVSAGGVSTDAFVSLSLTSVSVNPAALSFSGVAGDPAPFPQNVTLNGAAGVPWSATVSTVGGNWLQLSAPSGNLPAFLSVFVTTAGLAPGLYTGQISFGLGGLVRTVSVQLTVIVNGQLVVDPARVSLSSAAGSAIPVCAPVSIQVAGTTALDWSATSSAPWLAVQPGSGHAPASIGLCATAGSLTSGTYASTVLITSAAPNSPQSVAVSFTVVPPVAVSDGGVVSAASLTQGQSIAGGEILSVFGVNLASQTASATKFPLPTELANCRILIGGVAAALIYVSPNQVNLVAPSSLSSFVGSTTLNAFNGGVAAPAARVSVAQQAPGIFGLLSNGAGAGAITHNDGSVISRSSPVRPGEPISVYLTGIGPLDRNIGDGNPAPSAPLANAFSKVRLLIDGQEAAVLFAGAAPGFSGLDVVVATVPGLLSQRFPQIVVEVQGVASNQITAGGPSLLNVSPAAVKAGSDATVTLRGINLAPSDAVVVGGTTLPAVYAQADLQTLQVTIPGRLLPSAGSLPLKVVDTSAPLESPSNSVVLTVSGP